jgi:paraquat-inducible protein B
MNDGPTATTPEPPEAPVVKRRWRFSLVWLVPAVAAVIGLTMLVHTWISAGSDITISFRTAAGLEAGKTLVKYKDVSVGKVSTIALSDDGSHVLVTVALTKNAENLTRKDTRFWVVRPRISSSGVSGIDTLLSGAYIAADMGADKDTAKRFTGLETPPAVIRGSPGKTFNLQAPDLGSLDIGSPVYYKRVHVGRVTAFQLSSDGKRIDLQIFVDAPYDRFVTTDARFWNASGIDASVNAEGFKLNTQSLATIVAGGIAFDVPDGDAGTTSTANTVFTLTDDRKTAMAPPDGPEQYLQLRFDKPLRGLSVGATVKFSGIDLGHVVSVDLDYDPATQRFPTVVGIVVYPKHLGHVLDKLPKQAGDSEQQMASLLGGMVARGLRARARSGNLLTGQLYISLDFMAQPPKAIFNPAARPLTIPTIGGSFDDIQEQLASIVSKVDRMPLESIAGNLNASLSNLDKTLQQVNGQFLPQGTKTLQQAQHTFGAVESTFAEDAPLQQNVQQTLQEVQQAARSVRTLTDLLSRHPESLVRGLKETEQRPATRAPSNAAEPTR